MRRTRNIYEILNHWNKNKSVSQKRSYLPIPERNLGVLIESIVKGNEENEDHTSEKSLSHMQMTTH